MAITRIPEPYRSGFSKINKLSLTDVEAISAALDKSPLSGGLKGAIATVSEKVPTVSGNDPEDIVRALYSLYVYRADSDTPLPKFVSELVAAMRSSGKELSLTDGEKGLFQEKITKLLNINALEIASKAANLRTDFPYTFHGVRIITDIRPIFAKVEERPIGAAITHTMKVEYHDSGEHKEFYVALDAEDLEKMKKAIERAETKAASLTSLISSASLKNLSEEKSR